MKRIFLIILIIIFCTPINPAIAGIRDMLKPDWKKFDEQIENTMKAHDLGYHEKSKTELKNIYKKMDAELMEKLDDVNFQFVFAKCEFLLNRGAARKRFQVLAENHPKQKENIFMFLVSQAVRYKKKRDEYQARNILVYAYREFQTNQSRIKQAAMEYFQGGKSAMEDGRVRQALFNYETALQLNPSLAPMVRGDVLEQCQLYDANKAFQVLPLVYNHSPNDDWGEINGVAAELIKKEGLKNKAQVHQKIPTFQKLPKNARVMIVAIVFPPNYELIKQSLFPIILKDGKPSKLYRIKAKKFIFQLGGDNFYLETESGRRISPEDLRKSNNHFGNESFRIVPTNSKPVEIGIRSL